MNLKILTNVNGVKSEYGRLRVDTDVTDKKGKVAGQKDDPRAFKKVWRIIDSFFRKNHIKPTTIVFIEDGKERRIKANRTNFIRTAKQAKKLIIFNKRDYTTNHRSLEVTQVKGIKKR